MSSRTLMLATGNPHKVDELLAIFREIDLDVRLLSLGDAPDAAALREPRETGATFGENSQIKAMSYAAQTGMLCLADDSGLEIDALDGRPGVISSHYFCDGDEARAAGLGRAERDERNNERVLRELSGVPDVQRAARFVCVMTLATPGASGGPAQVLARSRGTMEGRIGLPPRVPAGRNGFGYDPLFLVAPGFEQAAAELSPAEKHAISHRGNAARKMGSQIKALFGW
jgi:XTP/dITP diphosphohydrolase